MTILVVNVPVGFCEMFVARKKLFVVIMFFGLNYKHRDMGIEKPRPSGRGFTYLLSYNYLSRRIFIISTAALATLVPGPKMAATPALYRKS